MTQRECMRRLRARRRAAGECVDCGVQSGGARRCALHTAANRSGRKVHLNTACIPIVCGANPSPGARRVHSRLSRVTCGNCLRWARAYGVTS